MDKKLIIEFFDSRAEFWDSTLEINDSVIREILSRCSIKKGSEVLDVASGTGVLFPYYIELGAEFTGIDISKEMVKIAKDKFPDKEILCGDAESFPFEKSYDVIMIHNAFPHFTDTKALFQNLSKALKKGGRLCVAHSISADELEKCHSGEAKSVSVSLPETKELSAQMSPFVFVDTLISDEKMYMVSGIKEK